MDQSFLTKLQDFRKLFIAAFDNPIARRRYDDEYAVACREAFNELMRLADTPPLSILLNTQGSSDIVKEAIGGLAGLLMPNPNWLQDAQAAGLLATSPEDVARLGGVVVDPMNRLLVQEPKQGHHDVGDDNVSSNAGD